jgi:hypothetical protein
LNPRPGIKRPNLRNKTLQQHDFIARFRRAKITIKKADIIGKMAFFGFSNTIEQNANLTVNLCVRMAQKRLRLSNDV